MDELLNVIIGLIVGIIIGIIYNSYNVLYKGPNSKEIKSKIYRDGENCYRLIPIIHICPSGTIKE